MSTGFIILRHVNSELTNLYWMHCYSCIRTYYPDHKIVIIDDSSDFSFVSEKPLVNTETIHSEFKGRGELLPYYYYSKYKWFDQAIILHDSVFIQKPIVFETDNVKFLWYFDDHQYDQPKDEKRILTFLSNHEELLSFHQQKHLWTGCFGCMTIIKHDFLKGIDDKYHFSNLLECITTRYNRCSFERVLACMLLQNINQYKKSLLGCIHEYITFNFTFQQYLKIKKQKQIRLPVIKVFTGR